MSKTTYNAYVAMYILIDSTMICINCYGQQMNIAVHEIIYGNIGMCQ